MDADIFTPIADGAPPAFHAAPCCLSSVLDSVICGDNVQTLSRLPSDSVDLVVTSPPYDDLRTYGGHSWNFVGLAGELTRVLKPGGVIVWVVADATVNGSETLTSMRQAIHFKDVCGLNVHDTMIYHKRGQHMERFGHRKYPGAWEYVLVLTKGQPKAWNPIRDIATIHAGERNSSTVRQPDGSLKRSHSHGRPCKEYAIRDNQWSYAVGSGHTDPDMPNDHPAAFPLRMASDHVASWSNPGDVVLDPFAGSGTTLKAAKELGRRFVGIEINAEYVEICQRRIAQEVLNLFPDNA